MIHHLSIAAANPRRVCEVLAEILPGKAFPFPPVDGGFVTICEDDFNTLVEVYPLGTEMVPGRGREQVQFERAAQPAAYTATHAALSVAVDEQQIHNIAAREGWRAVTCDRGGLFQVVEFWVENRVLIELLTPAMAQDYLEQMTASKWALVIGQGRD